MAIDWGRMTFGGAGDDPAWKYPAETLDFLVDLSQEVDTSADLPASVSIACKPSGPGELQLSGISVSGETVAFWAAGGQPNRRYSLAIVVQMSDGRTFEMAPLLLVRGTSSLDVPQPPASTDFGTPVTWSAAAAAATGVWPALLVPPTALLDDQARPILDENGAPILA